MPILTCFPVTSMMRSDRPDVADRPDKRFPDVDDRPEKHFPLTPTDASARRLLDTDKLLFYCQAQSDPAQYY